MNQPATNRESIERLFTAVLSNDRATADSLLDPDLTVYEPDGLPYAGVYKGHKGWWDLMEKINATWLDMKVEVVDLIGEPNGKQFGVYIRLSGCAAVSRKSFTHMLFERYTVVNRKLTEVHPHYWDTKALAELNSR